MILDVIRTRYPDVKAAISLGYWFTTAPQIHNGVIYIGSTRSESHIPGGHVLAVDAKTGKVLWHFNTIPQDEKDQGWDVAGPTWVGGERNGGGIWETPSIDPELGLHLRRGRQPVRRQHEARAGSTCSPIRSSRSRSSTGTLKWYYQQTHHDVWDYDSGNQPILFDMQVRGRRVKALAEASKNGFLYILNRETGQPVHPIKEDAGADRRRRGRANSRGRRSRFRSRPSGKTMVPVSARCRRSTFPPSGSRQRAGVPMFTPPGPNQISAPGTGGGANYGPLVLQSADGLPLRQRHRQTRITRAGRRRATSPRTIPTTGELVWQKTFDGFGQAGSVVTASDLVFVGTGSNIAGYFMAFDAKTGELLWKFNTGAGVFSSPSVYMVNGEQFVTVGSGGGERGRRGGDLILSFALPRR